MVSEKDGSVQEIVDRLPLTAAGGYLHYDNTTTNRAIGWAIVVSRHFNSSELLCDLLCDDV